MLPVDADLAVELGRQGDALWRGRLPSRDEGGEIPLDEWGPPGWSLVYLSTTALERHPGAVWAWPLILVLFFPMLAVDTAHLVVRLLAYPLVLAAWSLARAVAVRQGRGFLCAVCHRLTYDPWAYCPNAECPRRVQTRLRPRFHSFFLRTCPECGKGRWWLLRLPGLWPPAPLVCRHTDSVSGCHHPLHVKALAGGHPLSRVAVVGTSVPAKHAVLGQLFLRLTDPAEPAGYDPAWQATRLEVGLCRKVLCGAFTADTARYETPGKRYTLCWTSVFRARQGERTLVFHNLPDCWFDQTPTLAEKGTDWNRLGGLLFVLDAGAMRRKGTPTPRPPYETYARLVRVVEEHCALRPGQRLPFKVGVVLGVPPAEASLVGGPLTAEGLPAEAAEDLVRRHDPALGALLRRTAGPGRLRFFGGPLPAEAGSPLTGWLRDAVAWLR